MDVVEAEAAVASIIEAMGTLVTAVEDTTSPEVVLALVRGTQDIAREARDLQDAAKRVGLDVFDGNRDGILGGFRYEIGYRAKRQWEHDRLVADVCDVAVWDRTTGERRTAEDAIEVLREAFRIDGSIVRTTWLRDRGMDADLYSTKVWQGSMKVEPFSEREGTTDGE